MVTPWGSACPPVAFPVFLVFLFLCLAAGLFPSFELVPGRRLPLSTAPISNESEKLSSLFNIILLPTRYTLFV